ncbi:hypothetical protein HKBW3S42_01375 [Candidatus Hakubella thermalkaliphila]|uniref:AI-2E family transporter n=1 Tax=Candidatus Hakubella thermalkaliphila TaxID=2754717 RepID=A0A6V8PK77_9ACTN|nr:hypothetical protein HKBW3S42_01375 [Candidatus Hakubella thermalkaliphila]
MEGIAHAPRRTTSHENYVIFKGIAHAPRRTTSHENYVIFKGGSGTEVPGEPMEREKLELIKRVGIISWSLIGIGVIVLAALYLVYFLRFAFTPLVLAILLAYILSPLVSYFERWVPRIYSTLIAYLIFLSVVAIILVFDKTLDRT